MAKKRNKKVKVQKSVPKAKSKRHITMIIITVVFVLIVGSLILFFPRGETLAGQAFHSSEAGKFNIGDQGIKLSISKGNAAIGDTFDLTLRIKTGDKPIKQIKFNLENPSFDVTGSSAKSILKVISKPAASDPLWSVWDTGKVVKGELDIITLSFKLKSGAVDSAQKIILKNIQLVESTAVSYGPFTATTEITVADECTDADEDGYGKQGTDLRACSKEGNKAGTSNFDCEDDPNKFGKLRTPGKKEECDLVDNNCNGEADEGLSGAPNSELQGVCYGKKVCKPTVKGQSGWKDSFLVDDPNIKFNGVQQGGKNGLYEANTETKCDLYDNDCDGKINEGITCNLGASGKKIPPGLLVNKDDQDNILTSNAHYDYKPVEGTFVTQVINVLDIDMVGYFKDVRGDTSIGGTGQVPMNVLFKGKEIFVCDNGIYYKIRSDKVYEQSYNNNEKITTFKVANSQLFESDGVKKVNCK